MTQELLDKPKRANLKITGFEKGVEKTGHSESK